MTINKFQGKTKEEAIQKAKEQFGENAVIMNVKEIKPKGIFSAFKSSTYEVTAAMEENEKKTFSQSISKINLAADEKIKIPRAAADRTAVTARTAMTDDKAAEKASNERDIEKRLDNLSNILEEKLGNVTSQAKPLPPLEEKPARKSSEELKFIRMLYNTLLKNEVDERYINQIFEEIERFVRPGNSVDTILSNVYQKLILRLGQPRTISVKGAKPRVIFFIGPTGVGKTTTIAKIASKFKVEQDKKVAFITADTYRIAATEQLRVYANILDAPMSIVYSPEDINDAIGGLSDYDLIFVDTAGFSHKNDSQRADIKKLIDSVNPAYEKEVYLVISATTKYKDLTEIIDIYNEIADYKLIFTKLDETSAYGNLLNVRLYSEAELSYVTTGQNVPDDIEMFDTQKVVKQLLGGKD